MWRNVALQAGHGLLAIAEYFLKAAGFLAFFTVAGTRGPFWEKLSASFQPFTLFLDGGHAIYRQITSMAEIIVDYNTLEIPAFTEIYAEGTIDGVMQGLSSGARYIITVDQNVTLEPASTMIAATIGFGLFFGAGKALRIIRQRDRELWRIRLEKKLWYLIIPNSRKENYALEGKYSASGQPALGGQQHLIIDEKKFEEKTEMSEKVEISPPKEHGKLKLVILPRASGSEAQEDTLSSEKQPDQQDQVAEQESSDGRTQVKFTSGHDLKQPAGPIKISGKDASTHLPTNENGRNPNRNGHQKSKGTVDEELEKSLIRKLKEQEGEEENSQEKRTAPPKNYTLNQFLERARSS